MCNNFIGKILTLVEIDKLFPVQICYIKGRRS